MNKDKISQLDFHVFISRKKVKELTLTPLLLLKNRITFPLIQTNFLKWLIHTRSRRHSTHQTRRKIIENVIGTAPLN